MINNKGALMFQSAAKQEAQYSVVPTQYTSGQEGVKPDVRREPVGKMQKKC